MELYTEIEIQATADRVWQHLTDRVHLTLAHTSN